MSPEPIIFFLSWNQISYKLDFWWHVKINIDYIKVLTDEFWHDYIDPISRIPYDGNIVYKMLQWSEKTGNLAQNMKQIEIRLNFRFIDVQQQQNESTVGFAKKRSFV